MPTDPVAGRTRTVDPVTSEQDDQWAGERVARWLRQAEGLERQLAPVSEVLFAAAALQPGERVLDVGCGTGPTTRQAAALVGPTGGVTGLDISGEMLDAAASVPTAADAGSIDWLVADAVTWSPPEPTYDVVLSRFGVMFFSEPATAFANLAEATHGGGRLALAVWQWRPASDLFEVPLATVLTVRERHGLGAPDGLDPEGGPFSLGDVPATTALLEGSGWSAVTATPHRLVLPFGGGLGPDAAAEAAADFGPTRLALDGLDPAVRAEATATIAEVFGDHLDDAGHVALGGSILILTASR
jgi:2-polyprenyl-3-methyl-5-hydroxy-6-metoxy-1,4-benzoquinol methylase